MPLVTLHLEFSPERPLSLPDVLRDLEMEILTKALRETRGRPISAARMLGIGRQNFYMKLRRFEIFPQEFRK